MIIESFEIVVLTCIFLVPGFIITSIVSAFVPPKRISDGMRFLMYLAYSLIHFAVLGFAYVAIMNVKKKIGAVWFLVVIALTAIISAVVFGIIIGFIKRKNILRKLCKSFHNIDTAWDYIYSKQEHSYVVVTLKDDTTIYGWWGLNSFASSDIGERDMYLEKMFTEDWQEIEGNKGIYIAKDEIKTINYYKGDE